LNTAYDVYHNSAILPNTTSAVHQMRIIDRIHCWENLHSVYTGAGDRIRYTLFTLLEMNDAICDLLMLTSLSAGERIGNREVLGKEIETIKLP